MTLSSARLLAGAALAFATAGISLQQVNADAEHNIRIGAVATLSGPAAEQGKHWLDGAKLAVSDLKTEGIDVELIVEDDGTTPVRTTTAFRRMVAMEKVSGVIGGTWDFLAEAASKVSAETKTPFVTPTNPIEIMSPEFKNNPWAMTNGLSLAATEATFQEVIDILKPRTASIFAPNSPFGTFHADMVERVLEASGTTILDREIFEYTGVEDTMRTFATRTALKKPDFVFCLASYNHLALFTRDLRRRSFFPWIVSTQHLDAALDLLKEPQTFLRSVGLFPKIENQKFVDHYTQVVGSAPKVYSAEGYDAMIFLARALAKGVDLSKQPFSIDGVAGKLEYTPAKRDIVGVKAVALTVSADGKMVPFTVEVATARSH